MDIQPFIDIISHELDRVQHQPVEQLRLENHLYGAFLVMEDLAQGQLTWSTDGTWIHGTYFSIHLEQRFGHIGLRYGFLSEYTAQYTSGSEAYQRAWRDQFATISSTKDLTLVDAIEDAINDQLVARYPNGFFINVMDTTGHLSAEYLARAYELLFPEEMQRPPTDVPVDHTAIATAKTETPMHPSTHPVSIKTHRHLSRTRRARAQPSAAATIKKLATTRRAAH